MKTWPTFPAEEPAELARLAEMIPGAKDPEVARQEILHVSHWLAMGLHERLHSPSASDMRKDFAALENLKIRSMAVRDALRGLSPHSRQRFAEQMGWPPGEADARMEEAVLTSDAYANAAGEAKARLPITRVIVDELRPGDPDYPDDADGEPVVRRRGPGRPRDASARAAIRSLAELWEEQTGVPPTLATRFVKRERSVSYEKHGPFLAFAKAVMLPVYSANGVQAPSISSLIKTLLYPSDEDDTA